MRQNGSYLPVNLRSNKIRNRASVSRRKIAKMTSKIQICSWFFFIPYKLTHHNGSDFRQKFSANRQFESDVNIPLQMSTKLTHSIPFHSICCFCPIRSTIIHRELPPSSFITPSCIFNLSQWLFLSSMNNEYTQWDGVLWHTISSHPC